MKKKAKLFLKKKAPKAKILKPSIVRPWFSSMLAGLVFAGLFSGTVFVFATPPDSKYAPGDTLNPSCAVGSTNCSTVSPVPYSGATAAVDLGSQNLTTTGTTALGATTTLKYSSTNYTTLTAASDGDLTIATTSSSSGGEINISSAVTGDFTLLSNSGTLVLGGTGNSNNENLKFDFETYANKVAVTSGTSATDIDFGSLDLTTTGTLTLGGSTDGTLVTRVKAGAATESDTNGSLVVDSTNGRLYFRYGAAWHYVAQTAGFQIPDFETVDPLSGEQIKESDLVLGMINQTFEDGALHGVWVKWDSVKADLLAEARGELSKISSSSAGSSPENFLDKVKNGLFSLGISMKEGAAGIKELVTEKFSAKVAKIEKLEMIDKATGSSYCTWIENGEWQKAQGECGSVQVAQAPIQQAQEQKIQQEQIIQQVKEDLKPQIESQVISVVEEEVQESVEQEIEEQVEKEVKEEVKEMKEEIKDEVKEEAKEEVKEETKEEDIVPVFDIPELPAEPIIEEEVTTPADEAIQEVSEAVLETVAWAAGAIVPKEVKQFSAMVFGFGQSAVSLAVDFATSAPAMARQSTAGLLGPFIDLKDFINKKY